MAVAPTGKGHSALSLYNQHHNQVHRRMQNPLLGRRSLTSPAHSRTQHPHHGIERLHRHELEWHTLEHSMRAKSKRETAEPHGHVAIASIVAVHTLPLEGEQRRGEHQPAPDGFLNHWHDDHFGRQPPISAVRRAATCRIICLGTTLGP